MSINRILLKIAGKDNFSLSNDISTRYIFGLCVKYGMMMLRGKMIAFFYKSISNDIFVGKHVVLKEIDRISIGPKTKIHDGVVIDALSTDGVKIGKNVVIGQRTEIECTGGLESIGKGVVIGDRTTFGRDCLFGAAGGIEIGRDVVAGQQIRFHSENHNYDDLDVLIRDQGVSHKGIKIGNNCWIGAGAVFLDGSELGDGCVVAANAVVTKKFPSNSVIAGIPAKIIKTRGI